MPIFPNLEPEYLIKKELQLNPEEYELIQHITRGIFEPQMPFPSLPLPYPYPVDFSGFNQVFDGDPNPQPNLVFNEGL